MQPAQFIPFGGVAGKIGGGAGFARGADRGEMAPVFGALRGKLRVVAFGHGQQLRGRRAKRRGAARADGAAQEHPAAFLAPFSQPSIAQDPNMAGNPRLALSQHLCQFSHSQFHCGKQPHNPKPGWVRERAQGGIDQHRGII